VANHKSSVKRAKQDKLKRMTNKIKTSKAKTAIKAVKTAIAAGDKNKAKELLVVAQSMLGKLAKSPAMTKKTAARKTSRIASQVANLLK
jgi:small subunit ribosomal protein S20